MGRNDNHRDMEIWLIHRSSDSMGKGRRYYGAIQQRVISGSEVVGLPETGDQGEEVSMISDFLQPLGISKVLPHCPLCWKSLATSSAEAGPSGRPACAARTGVGGVSQETEAPRVVSTGIGVLGEAALAELPETTRDENNVVRVEIMPL